MSYQMIGLKHPIIKEIKGYKKKFNNKIMIIEDLSILKLRYKYNFKVLKFLYCDEKIFSDESKKIKSLYLTVSSEIYAISSKVYNSLSDKENSAGMIAVVAIDLLNLDSVDIVKNSFILVLDGIELPGNLGTIFRTADAINIDLVINVDLVTSVFNNRTLSNSRGMCLKVPFVNTTYEKAQQFLLDNKYRILLSEPKEGTCYSKMNYDGKIAIVVGNERFGINKKWYDNTHEKLYIPMYGDSESLNVGVATSILLYEAKNKRNQI